MKRRVLSIIQATVLCVALLALVPSLAACGSPTSTPSLSSPLTANTPAPAEPSPPTANTPAPAEPATPTANTPASAEPATPTPEPDPPADTITVTGIIVLHATGQSFSTGSDEVVLIAIDPSTGTTRDVRAFPNIRGKDFYYYPFGKYVNNYTGNIRIVFDSEFNRIVAVKRMPDGSTHVGWVDTDGNFFDVIEKVMPPTGDFSGLTNYVRPRFGPDNCFFFENEYGKEYRVSLDNLTTGAYEQWHDSLSQAGVYYSDDTMTYGAINYICDWISPSSFIGEWDGQLHKYDALKVDNGRIPGYYPNSYAERYSILPYIADRVNYNAVVSPDMTTVAFLSRLTRGTDKSPYLFTVSVDGGEPAKVNTSCPFALPNSGVHFPIWELIGWF